MSTTPKASQPLIVVVSGGGPVGLTFSLHLTMMMGKNVKIIIYEGRWFVDQQGKTRWQGEEQGKIRRDQVVTLQDHVINQMPEYIQKGLFAKYNERVWPTSRNIPIREVEDRLFELIQPFVQTGQVELIPENLHEQSECIIKGTFDALVGTDGSNSFVRRYCNIQMVSEGLEYACGVAYNIPEKVQANEEPLHQALNCILTVSQTRYLVNSSTSRRGYLNIRLIQNEYDELRERLVKFQSCNEALDLTDTNKCPHSPVWDIIRQGLEYFKIPSRYVFRVLPIEINVRHASIVVRELRYEIETAQPTADREERHYRTALAFLAGDAAMNVHFWPGRGMNSGMKGAMALARNIVRACTVNNAIQIRTPLRFLDFLEYEGFMARLRGREQQGRSLRVLSDPIDQSIEASYIIHTHLTHCYIKYSKKLIEKLKETRDRLEKLSGWPHDTKKVTDEELKSASKRISPQSVAQLSLANPWPTREMSGAEVLVEHTFPYDLNSFLPLPVTGLTKIDRRPTMIIRYRFINLWIIGTKLDPTIDSLVRDIQGSPNFNKTSANADKVHQLIVVRTAEEANAWIKSNRDLIEKADVRFKVITLWTLKTNQCAVDVIRAVRSETPRVPVLIFTNKFEETKPALEFPNVMATVEEYELKEFVGVNQETQWNPGCRVEPIQLQPKPVKPSSLPYPTVDNSDFPALPKLVSNLHISFAASPPPVPSHLKPILLWIDSETNDPTTAEQIRTKHPTLELRFLSTFKDAETYVDKFCREMEARESLIVICRGFYALENKGYLNVAELFRVSTSPTTHLAVYTRNRANLLEKAPNVPREVQIFEKRGDLLGFIDQYLKH